MINPMKKVEIDLIFTKTASKLGRNIPKGRLDFKSFMMALKEVAKRFYPNLN